MKSNSHIIRQSFKGTVVNRALPSLYRGSLKNTLKLVRFEDFVKISLKSQVISRDTEIREIIDSIIATVLNRNNKYAT